MSPIVNLSNRVGTSWIKDTFRKNVPMSIFNKQHYAWLASVGRDQLNEARETGGNIAASAVAVSLLSLADALENENPLTNENPDGFDRDRFLTDCGVFSPETNHE